MIREQVINGKMVLMYCFKTNIKNGELCKKTYGTNHDSNNNIDNNNDNNNQHDINASNSKHNVVRVFFAGVKR